MVKKIRIHKHEVGLWFRHGDFRDVLAAGRHWFFGFLRNRVEVYDAAVAKFDHPKLEVLVAEPALAAKLTVVELTDTQRALVWKDRRLGWILGPGRHAFWKEPAKIEVEVFDVSDFKLEHPKIDVILGHPGGVRFFEGVRVEAHERVLLFREGELVEQLGPGIHVFWKHAGKITWKAMDLREQATDVAGQEIMTADKVTLRVNLLVTHQVVDVVKAVAVVADAAQALYREAQLALR
ncbi:MAG: SPFH domain-containing protein, partial [Phycisphaerae bacterium]|nr:SPFH domain-containing protein [Phycisphaerae bacterium]